MVRGWIYSIIGAIVVLSAFRSAGPRRDPRLLPPARASSTSAARSCRSKRSPSAASAERLSPPQSGVIPDVAPSEVQTRTMSRIERTPTSSASSKTTRWRMPRRDISAAARSRLQSGAAAITPLAHVVGDQLDVGVLAGAERDQDVALGDDPGRRQLVVADQRRAGALLDHHRRRLAQGVRRADRQDHLRHPVPHLHLRPPLAASLRVSANRLKPTRPPARDRPLSGGARHIDSGALRAACQASRNSIRPLLVLAALAAVVVAASGCGTTTADTTRGRVLFIAEVRHLPHPGPGGDDGRRSAPTSTTPSPPPAKPARTATRSKAIVKAQVEYPRPEQRRPGGLDAGRHRQRPGPRRRRRLRRHVRRRARRGAAEGARRPRRPGLRQQRLRRLPHARRRRNRAA